MNPFTFLNMTEVIWSCMLYISHKKNNLSRFLLITSFGCEHKLYEIMPQGPWQRMMQELDDCKSLCQFCQPLSPPITVLPMHWGLGELKPFAMAVTLPWTQVKTVQPAKLVSDCLYNYAFHQRFLSVVPLKEPKASGLWQCLVTGEHFSLANHKLWQLFYLQMHSDNLENL